MIRGAHRLEHGGGKLRSRQTTGKNFGHGKRRESPSKVNLKRGTGKGKESQSVSNKCHYQGDQKTKKK